MMTVWMMSQVPQEARVSAFCSGVAVPKHRPWARSGAGFYVHRETRIARAMQNRNIQTQNA